MSVRLSLLAILRQERCYGYQLKAEFDRRTGSIWPLNVGQIYSTLDRLLRDELVTRAAADSQGQSYFEITDAGQSEVDAWFRTPVVRTAASRDELAIKVAMAVTLSGVDAAQVIEVQRRATLATLHDLSRAKSLSAAVHNSEDLARDLVVDSLVFAAEAEIRWLEHAESALAAAASEGAALPSPVSSHVRKRGRPSKPTG